MTTTSPRLLPRTALAALAVVGVLLTGCGEERVGAPPQAGDAVPAAAPAAPAPPEVPADFPLAAGLPATNGDDATPVEVTDRPTWTEVRLCGEVAWSRQVPLAVSDLAGASYTGEAEDSRSRLLALYADPAGARQALDALVAAYTACGVEGVGGTDQVHEVVATGPGSATVTHRYRGDQGFDTGLELVQLRVVGRALFLGSYYAEANGDQASVDAFTAFAERSSQPVWDAMAVFADRPAATDVPLAAGWPATTEPGEAGVVLPVTDSEPDVERDFGTWACGTPAPEASGEVLRARFADVEDYRARRLVVLPDADAAVSYVSGLRDFYAACPEQSGPDATTYPVALVDTAVGGQSFGLVRFTESGGEPAVGTMALHVVRVGRSVLLDAAATEGSAGQQELGAAARDRLGAMATASAEVVTAQCAFTVAGC